MKKRIVITGLGTVNSLGHNVEDTWKAIQEGQIGIGPITKFDASDYPAKIAAEVKNFTESRGKYLDSKDARKMDDFSAFAVYAGKQAMEDAGLEVGKNIDPENIGVILGNGIGGLTSLELAYEKLLSAGPSRIPPMTIPKLIINEAPANTAIALGAQGPCYALVTACAAGTDAIGDAARLIEHGIIDVAVTGGTEASITKMGIGGFCVLHALSTKYNDTPQEASRPFDKDRDGFVMGEGAGILILEELEHAKKRGATIYAELAGSGMSCDADHLTAPHPEGRGAIAAMKMALSMADMDPKDIDYINAHGTSTPVNDPTETLAIKKVFGDHAYKLKVSSTKSMTGHCVGAAGGIEAIFSILSIRDGVFPPTMNINETDERCDLDYVPNKAQKGSINAVMSNSLGFGGHNGIVIFKKYED
ncbi:beta-ketoacyl-ACP synthase II [Spirochaeta cellobiosiphila]|uniref:beta-ketoacyl-ACP synthase II n=1 Tax=Spirochaeta cellobiosiphila TaxID=504483 RepID=UPI000413F4F2|nr:beta-ketoacyl-ACP synthase II [Spirochaeta cellobiosiphila]